jgi:hypothetical protein
MARPSTYAFFLSYVCIAIAAVAQATFLPTILGSVRFGHPNSTSTC